jgi:hypothetical protein
VQTLKCSDVVVSKEFEATVKLSVDILARRKIYAIAERILDLKSVLCLSVKRTFMDCFGFMGAQ